MVSVYLLGTRVRSIQSTKKLLATLTKPALDIGAIWPADFENLCKILLAIDNKILLFLP